MIARVWCVVAKTGTLVAGIRKCLPLGSVVFVALVWSWGLRSVAAFRSLWDFRRVTAIVACWRHCRSWRLVVARTGCWRLRHVCHTAVLGRLLRSMLVVWAHVVTSILLGYVFD